VVRAAKSSRPCCGDFREKVVTCVRIAYTRQRPIHGATAKISRQYFLQPAEAIPGALYITGWALGGRQGLHVFFMCFVDQETAAWGAEYMSGATSK
jgi:hypothetical protein